MFHFIFLHLFSHQTCFEFQMPRWRDNNSVFTSTVDGLIFVGYQFSWFSWSDPRILVPTKQPFSVCFIKENTMATNFEPHECVIFIRPTCWDVLWYGAGVCPSVCLSVRLSTKLVNTIQTEPFQLGSSNLVHLLLMTKGRTLLIFKVRGQRSRSQVTHSC